MRVYVRGHYRKNGSYVKGHYRNGHIPGAYGPEGSWLGLLALLVLALLAPVIWPILVVAGIIWFLWPSSTWLSSGGGEGKYFYDGRWHKIKYCFGRSYFYEEKGDVCQNCEFYKECDESVRRQEGKRGKVYGSDPEYRRKWLGWKKVLN